MEGNFLSDGFGTNHHLSIRPSYLPDQPPFWVLVRTNKDGSEADQAQFFGPWLPLAWDRYKEAVKTENLVLAKATLNWLPEELRRDLRAWSRKVFTRRTINHKRALAAECVDKGLAHCFASLPKYLRGLIKALEAREQWKRRWEPRS